MGGDSLAEEAANRTTATTQTRVEGGRDKQGRKRSTQSCLVCLGTTTCQIVSHSTSTKEDLTRIKGASTKDLTRSGVNVNAPTSMERLTKALKRQSVEGMTVKLLLQPHSSCSLTHHLRSSSLLWSTS